MNNSAIDLLSLRRSVPPRALKEPGPDQETLTALLTIASRVPDHGKLVPWRFIVIGSEAGERLGEQIEALYLADHPEASDEQRAKERGRLSQAPLVVAVVAKTAPHPKIPEWEQTLSVGAVCMNLLNVAHAKGLAACWLTGWIAYDRRVLDLLGLGATEQIAGYIHIGTPAETPPDRPRPVLTDIVTVLS